MKLFAVTTFAMEKITQNELIRLGIQDISIQDGRVYFEGDQYALAQACIWLRSADRIFWQVADFDAASFDELFDQLYAIRWENFIPREAALHISAKCVRSQIMSLPDTQKIAKRAIIKALQRKYQQERFTESGALYPIEISILKDHVTVAIDCCGEGLHKRGYRTLNAEAPLRETLAAGLLLLAQYKSGMPFMDPLCGSGTLPIEAAMIDANMAPGRSRSFVCEQWKDFTPALWNKVRAEAIAQEISTKTDISGSDISAEMIEMSQVHAAQAGLNGKIRFIKKSVRDISAYRDCGLIVTNPPYGQRLGDGDTVAQLCNDMAYAFAGLQGWDYGILSAYKDFEKQFGRKADKVRRLYNANLECGFYQYFNK